MSTDMHTRTKADCSTQRLRDAPYWLVTVYPGIDSLRFGMFLCCIQTHCVIDDFGDLVAVRAWL